MGRQTLQVVLALAMAVVLSSAVVAQAVPNRKLAEVRYTSYRIYQQADSTMPGMKAIEDAFTYAIVRNPDAAVSIDGGTIAEQASLLGGEDMRRCEKMPSDFDLMLGRKQEYEQLIAAQQKDPKFFNSMPNAAALLPVAKNLLAFNADAKGLPIYYCYTDSWRVHPILPVVQDDERVPPICNTVVDAMLACSEARANSTIHYTSEGRSKLAKASAALRELKAKLPSLVAPSNFDDFTKVCSTAWRNKAIGLSDVIVQELTVGKDTDHANQCTSAMKSIR